MEDVGGERGEGRGERRRKEGRPLRRGVRTQRRSRKLRGPFPDRALARCPEASAPHASARGGPALLSLHLAHFLSLSLSFTSSFSAPTGRPDGARCGAHGVSRPWAVRVHAPALADEPLPASRACPRPNRRRKPRAPGTAHIAPPRACRCARLPAGRSQPARRHNTNQPAEPNAAGPSCRSFVMRPRWDPCPPVTWRPRAHALSRPARPPHGVASTPPPCALARLLPCGCGPLNGNEGPDRPVPRCAQQGSTQRPIQSENGTHNEKPMQAATG